MDEQAVRDNTGNRRKILSFYSAILLEKFVWTLSCIDLFVFKYQKELNNIDSVRGI